MIRSSRNWSDVPPAQSEAAIKAYARQVGEALRGELMLSSARNKYLLQRIERTLEQVIAAHEAAARRNRLRPLRAEVGFGIGDAVLPPYEIQTPDGRLVQLYGKIDRVDLIEDQAAFAVIDYKLRGNTLQLDRVYHGLSLQLLTYLLVLESSGEKLAGRKLTPAAAFYVKLMRQLEKTDHPDDAMAPDDPLFNLREKPRGIFSSAVADSLDTGLEDGGSSVVSLYRKKDGSFGRKGSTDVAEPEEFGALLQLVRQRLTELGGQIMDGEIGITPYRHRQESPCGHCDYRSICRFDVQMNPYRPLDAMSREQVLERAMQQEEQLP
jgi:ATP-dependent helicase/nuclease subunit B